MQHILVVDDLEMVAYSFQRYFEHHGYRVTVANDGPSALEAVKDDPIDAVITDYRMPGMNGVVLLNELRKKQPRLPALIVSAYIQEINMREDVITKIIKKPAMLQDMLRAMQAMLPDRQP